MLMQNNHMELQLLDIKIYLFNALSKYTIDLRYIMLCSNQIKHLGYDLSHKSKKLKNIYFINKLNHN